MAKIKDLPQNERPREKALLFGIEKLSNAELLALLISSGSKKMSSLEIANNLLVKTSGIENLKYLTLDELLEIEGINKAKALNILSIFEIAKRSYVEVKRKKIDINYLFEYFKSIYQNEKQEKSFLVLLNNKDELLFIKELFVGNENSLAFSSRVIISYIVKYDAKKYYLIHNHPSGNPQPSKNDILTTNTLELITLGISCSLVDHLIFGTDSCYSIIQKKQIK